jgi:ABC-type lipoprotein release transport system permease subunit
LDGLVVKTGGVLKLSSKLELAVTTLVSVIGLTVGVSFAACLIPSGLAARVDPSVSLRYE